MKVILSHPYCGPLYWWFSQEKRYALPKQPEHRYYAALLGDVDRHLDVALACALIYEDFVIPPADAAYPGIGPLQDFSAADLGLEVSPWDPLEEALRLTEEVVQSWQSDAVLCEILRGRTETEVHLELVYAVADVVLAAEYGAPVLCSDGRRAVVRRLIELGVVAAQPEVVAQLSAEKSVGALVDSYAQVAGLTFGTDGIREFADLKWTSELREYAEGFQRALNDPGTTSTDDLYQAIANALDSKALAERAQGAFEAAGHVMDVAGLIPGVGTVAGLVGLGSDAAALAGAKRVERVRWFELSGAVAGTRSRLALEAELRNRGLMS